MSHSDFFSTVRSSGHDFIAAFRFLDDYAKHIYNAGRHHQTHRHFVPRFDLEQHPNTYELYGELPGFRREDIIIEAHDDHNLQVSGSISCLTSQPQPPSESKKSKNATNSTTEPQDQQPPQEASNNEETKLTEEPAPRAKVPPEPLNRLEATVTSQERYLNGRFGDVLDPQAGFDRDEEDTEANADPALKVRCLISERHPSAFHRAFHFPTPIKKGEVVATMQDGILHITAPRAPMPPPVKVKVRPDLENYPAVLI